MKLFLLVLLSTNLRKRIEFPCITGSDTSPIFILFNTLSTFFDKDLEFIQPRSPLFRAVADELNFIAVFSNPISLICFFIV